jgi:hypothetical protein
MNALYRLLFDCCLIIAKVRFDGVALNAVARDEGDDTDAYRLSKKTRFLNSLTLSRTRLAVSL